MTTPADLEILIQEGEGTTLEFKEGLSASFARELVAMANTIGGRILLGVRDDGTVVGLRDSNVLRARIQDIAHNCDPQVQVRVEPVGRAFVVHVRESEKKPVQCSEGFFWRQGAVTQKLTRDEIREFFRREGAIRFDLSVSPRFRYPADFDREKFEAWRRLSGISGDAKVEDVLVNLEVAERSGKRLLFRHAGVLFFAREPRRFFNQAYVTCLLFRGTDKVHVLDRKDFAGGVVADIEDSLRFIERNTRLAYRIERLQREEIPEYPMAALREAITNAVMHRDWFNEGANVFVEIYADRIEVSSPGGLPSGMLPSDLGRKSVRRNPLIADLLHRIDFIEKAGTGVRRMRETAKKHGSPAPVFETTGFFTAIFRPLAVVAVELAGEVARDSVSPRAGLAGLAPKLPPEPSRNLRDGTKLGTKSGTKLALSRHQVEILQKCLTGQPLTGLLSVAGRSDRTKFRHQVLGPLLNEGLLEMTIPDKPRSSRQRYRTTAKGREVLEDLGRH